MIDRILRLSRAAGLAFASALAALPALVPGAAVAAPGIVADAYSGQVYFSEDATRHWHPASTTKMMTAYVALKLMRDGRVNRDTPLVASGLAARQRPAKVGIRAGEIITLDNALKVMMVKSANDIAYVIGENLGGSVEGFASMMNAEARRLGMNGSNFVNPNGWAHPNQYVTARDLAVLASSLLKEFPEYRSYWGIGAVQLGSRVMKNTNGLVGRYPGTSGMKTGFVCASGFNVVATANRGGKTLVAVVLGAGSGAERTVRASQLLDQGFSSWGGTGSTLSSMASSGYGSAPNICAELRRRGVPLSDDWESDAAIVQTAHSNSESNNSVYDMLRPTPRGSGSVTRRSSSGRVVLGQRADFVPVAVYLGRAPGSSAPVYARAPSSNAEPARALAALPDKALGFAASSAPTRREPPVSASAGSQSSPTELGLSNGT